MNLAEIAYSSLRSSMAVIEDIFFLAAFLSVVAGVAQSSPSTGCLQ